MKNTHKTKAVPTAEQIAQMADKGGDISKHFTNRGKMMPAIRRVNVDFAENMLNELDSFVSEMNVSRQAVIKTLVRHALDQHYLAQRSRRP